MLVTLSSISYIPGLSQVLVTHHVELVLPGTYYLVRMLDGRIDTQGLVKDLRARGLLEGIASDESVEVRKEEEAAATETASPETQAVDGNEEDVSQSPAGVGMPAKAKKPRKLIEDEHREEGSVKWRIYKTYLKAS